VQIYAYNAPSHNRGLVLRGTDESEGTRQGTEREGKGIPTVRVSHCVRPHGAVRCLASCMLIYVKRMQLLSWEDLSYMSCINVIFSAWLSRTLTSRAG